MTAKNNNYRNFKPAIFLTTTILLLTVISTGNIYGKSLKLGKSKYIKSLKCTIKMFDSFESRPINFPSSYTFKGTKDKLFKTKELWQYKQYVGSWGNDSSSIIIAEISYMYPKSSPTYISNKQFSDLKKDEKTVYWDKKRRLEWLKEFTDQKISDKIKSIKLLNATSIDMYTVQDSTNLTGLFIITNKKYSTKCIVVQYLMDRSIPLRSAKRLMYKSVKSIMFKNGSKSSNNKYKSKKQSNDSEYQTSRELVMQNIKNLRDWWGMEAENFFIITNYSKKSKRFIKKIKLELINSQKLYSKYYKRTVPLKEINVVRVFKDRKSYLAYVGKSHKWTIGLWMPSKKELVISPVDTKNRKDKESDLLQVLRHEAFHQYIHYALDQTQTSPWFNEGNAAFFEGIKKVHKKYTIQPVDKYLKTIKIMIKNKTINISSLIKMDYKDFYKKDKSSENYALAWGIIYFLNKRAPKIKGKIGKRYSSILKTYYKELDRSKSAQKATAKAWKRVSMKRFTNYFIKFYKNL